MTALIIDTETHKMHGNAIEIAWLPVRLQESGVAQIDLGRGDIVRLNPLEPIDVGAMAVHHIIDSDVADKPAHNTFKFPEFEASAVEYMIGHNINYDVDVVARCGIDVAGIKQICTLALARSCWPDFEKHNLTYLTYALADHTSVARQDVKDAHCAWDDVLITAKLLNHIVKLRGIKSMGELYELSELARVPTHMPFGKHQGKLFSDIPKDYIVWGLKNMTLDLYLHREFTKQVAGF